MVYVVGPLIVRPQVVCYSSSFRFFDFFSSVPFGSSCMFFSSAPFGTSCTFFVLVVDMKVRLRGLAWLGMAPF